MKLIIVSSQAMSQSRELSAWNNVSHYSNLWVNNIELNDRSEMC